MCDTRRELKKKKKDPQGAVQYRETNNKIRKAMKATKVQWIEDQCDEIDKSLASNNSMRAYQIVKDLTRTKQAKVSTIQDKSGKSLTDEQEIHERWTEYCSELYNNNIKGDYSVLIGPYSTNTQELPILRAEIEAAMKSMKKGKSPGVDNIPAELIQAGGEAMVDALHTICNKIWQTGQWPTQWTQSLIITIPKKGNLQLCSNYRTISLISHPSKVMLKIILNRLKAQAEEIIADEQAGFREGRSTTEQILNLRILMEKYLQHQQDLFHVFIDFKKAFDRVWHQALWTTMHKYNIHTKLITTIQNLYEKATSAVLHNENIGDWFRTTVGVRLGCLLSPTLFNIFLERIMHEALEDHEGTVTVGGRLITNLRFADDIDGLAGTEKELGSMIGKLDKTSRDFGMEISAEKTKIMTNRANGFTKNIKLNNQELEEVTNFKYLGAIVTDEGSRREVLSRIAQATSALTKLKTIWKDKHITSKHKIRFLRSLVISIFLYACETWTLTAELERRIQAFEMRCYRRMFGLSYIDRITNKEVRDQVRAAIGPHYDLLSIVKMRKLTWYGHVMRSSGLAKTISQGTVPGGRKRGRQRKRWEDNIRDWTNQPLARSLRMVEDREGWRRVIGSSVVPQQPDG